MLTYLLFVALTNLVMGIVLGYFYGPLFRLATTLPATPAQPAHALLQSQSSEQVTADSAAGANAQPEGPRVAESAPAEIEPARDVPSEAPRPAKQTGSREVTALDLADVISELGLETPATEQPAGAAAAVAS